MNTFNFVTSLNKHFQLKIHLTVCLAQSNLASFSLFLIRQRFCYILPFCYVLPFYYISSFCYISLTVCLGFIFVTVILYSTLLLHFTFQWHLNNICYILLHLTFLLHSCDSLSTSSCMTRNLAFRKRMVASVKKKAIHTLYGKTIQKFSKTVDIKWH